MKSVFIAGTDTGVGKTFITTLICRYLDQQGVRVVPQKWIQTGTDDGRSDIKTIITTVGEDYPAAIRKLMEPYRFRYPASPHLAARREKKRISRQRIMNYYRKLASLYETVIVEGSGGLLVPINRSQTMLDIVTELKLPVLLVVGNKLGCINHTLLSIAALKQRNLSLAGVIFNNLECGPTLILKDNPKIVAALSGANVLGVMNRLTVERAGKTFQPIGKKIQAILSIS